MSARYYRFLSPFRRMWIDPFEMMNRPSRFMDHMERSLIPPEIQRLIYNPEEFFRRPWKALEYVEDASDSSIKYEKDKFVASLDVQQFRPEEISVKIGADNTITVEGKHEEKEDQHGYIQRQFLRKYVLPKGHDISKIESTLSSDGILTICAPKIPEEVEELKSIPITQTGKPLKAVEDNKSGEKIEGGPEKKE